MYEKHFNLTQLPFSIAPDPSFLYLSSAHREALAHLMYGFSHGGFVMVTGEVGTGKTTLLRNLIKQTPPDLDVAFILNPRLTVRELLATLCDELGIHYNPDSTASVKQYVDLITRHLLETHRSGRSTVMIIDEAQNLSPAVLEQVRLLTNLETDERKLLRIILIGQPELAEMLDRQDLRQLAQRITARYHLGSLSRPDTYAYIMHRMSRAGGNPHAFAQSALRRLYALSKGTPRLVNVIADRALLGAYTEGRQQVTGRIVNRAAREVLGRQESYRPWWIGATVALTAAGAAWAILSPVGLPGTNPSDPVDPSATAAEAVEPGSPALIENQPRSTDAAEPRHTASSTLRTGNRPATSERSTSGAATTAQTLPASEPPGNAAGTVIQPPVETATPTVTDDGEAIITPETYGRMQADARTEGEASRRPTLTTERDPRLNPDSGSARRVESVSRPAGGSFGNQRLAYAAVFQRWGVDYTDLHNEIPCDFAPSAGLQCLSERGDWTQIAQLNLPVVIELWDDQASPYYAALLGLANGRVRLHIGSETVETTQRELREQWAGNYVVLWQTPPGYYGSLRTGQSHETVGWLRQQLSSLVNQSLASPRPDLFDDNLYQAVLEFQATEGLTTDGIVGPATWIKLANRLHLPQPNLAG